MLSTEPTNYSVQAAGKALASDAWSKKKESKLELSRKCRESATHVRIPKQVRNAAQSFAEVADVCLDKFIARVEAICRRDGADELLKKLDAVMPLEEPEGMDSHACLR